MSTPAGLEPVLGSNVSSVVVVDPMIDFDFLVFLVGFLSCCSVLEKSQADKKPFQRKWFLYYDLLQVALNAVVAFRIYTVLSDSGDIAGFATRNTGEVKDAIQLHYYTKWLDVGFTGLLIVSRRWRKLNVLHLFHHATIGPIWWYVLQRSGKIDLAAYGT